MTNIEILDAFLVRHGVVRKKGESIRLVLPWYIMDIVFQIYDKDIKDFDIKGKSQLLNRWRNKWKEAYNKFNKDFFDCFDTDQTNDIVERFDEFQDYVNHNLYILYIAILDVFERFESDKDAKWQETAAKCFLAELLCSYAEKIWRDITDPSLEHQLKLVGTQVKRFRGRIQDPSVKGWMKGVAKKMSDVSFAAQNFCNVFYNPRGMIAVRKIEKINTNGDAFYNRILLYSNEA